MVLTTMQLIKEGVNCPEWDRLFLTTSIKDPVELEQVIGRIRRKCNGKEDAVVYDFVDHPIQSMRSHFRARQKVYKQLKAKVTKENFL